MDNSPVYLVPVASGGRNHKQHCLGENAELKRLGKARLVGLASIMKMWGHRRIVLAALVPSFFVAIMANMFIPSSYLARSRIVIKESQKNDAMSTGESGFDTAWFRRVSADVDVNKVVATSRPNIQEMVIKLQLRDGHGNLFNADQLTEAGLSSWTRQYFHPEPKISIDQYGDTNVLEITGTSPDPEEAQKMANTLAGIIVDQNQTQMRQSYRSARDFLANQIKIVKGRFINELHGLTDLKKREGTLDLTVETNLAAKKMADMMQQKEDVTIALAQRRAELGRLKRQLSKENLDFVSASTLKDNPQIKDLKQKLIGLRLQLAQATSELMEEHPRVQSLREQVKEAELRLDNEIDIYRKSAPEVNTLERDIASLEARLKGINVDIDSHVSILGNIPDKAFKKTSFDVELGALQKSYADLLGSMNQIGLAEATTLSQIGIVETAAKPGSPYRPAKTVNTILGLIIGLAIGTAIAFIKEHGDDTVQTAEDLKGLRPMRLIGKVPMREGAQLISGVDSNDPFYESYRRIRTCIDFANRVRQTPLKSLLVTSILPQEGKSTVVANLAVSACTRGKRVAIVDTDLRRPSLSTIFHVPNNEGLGDVLMGLKSAEEVVQDTHIEGLSIIPSGQLVSDPAGMIESDMMGQVLSQLRYDFDLVMMDSAPLLVKSDALVLSNYADESIVVIGCGKATRHHVQEVMMMLSAAHIDPLGFVLNRIKPQKTRPLFLPYRKRPAESW